MGAVSGGWGVWVGGYWVRGDGGVEVRGKQVVGLVMWERMCICTLQMHTLWEMFKDVILD